MGPCILLLYTCKRHLTRHSGRILPGEGPTTDLIVAATDDRMPLLDHRHDGFLADKDHEKPNSAGHVQRAEETKGYLEKKASCQIFDFLSPKVPNCRDKRARCQIDFFSTHKGLFYSEYELFTAVKVESTIRDVLVF